MDKTGIQMAVEVAGDQSKLARRLGVAPQAVQLWVAKGFAPVGRARQIGMVTGVDHKLLVDPVIRDLFEHKAEGSQPVNPGDGSNRRS